MACVPERGKDTTNTIFDVTGTGFLMYRV